MLEITSSPTQKQIASEFGRANTGWNFSLQVKSRKFRFNTIPSVSDTHRGNYFTWSLLVVDELANFGVILGQDWFHDFNPNVDFDNDVVHIKSCSLTEGRIM